MPAELLLPTARASDTSNTPYSGAVWSFFIKGTSTPQAVYADPELSTSLGSTVTADAAGKFVPIYFDPAIAYRGVCKDATGAVTLHDIAQINPGAGVETSFGISGTLTVGPTGDYGTLVQALDLLNESTIVGPLTIQLQAGATLADLTIPSAGYTLYNPNSGLVTITGAPGYSVFADDSLMSGHATLATAKAADIALMQTRYPSVILLDGPDDILTTTGGIAAPNGLNFSGVGIWSKVRYSIDVGYNRGHGNAGGNGKLGIHDVALMGGVWGAIIYGGTFVRTGTNFFGHQKNSGPYHGFHSSIETPTGTWTAYTPRVASWADAPKYGEALTNCVHEIGASVTYRIEGYFPHGMYLNFGSKVYFDGEDGVGAVIEFDGPTSFVTLMRDSQFSLAAGGAEFKNANPANTAATAGAAQYSIPGNSYQSYPVFLGIGCHFLVDNITISGCEDSGIGEIPNAIYCGPGSTLSSLDGITINDCKFGDGAIRLEGSFEHSAKVRVTAPRAGSNNQLSIVPNGGMHLYDDDGSMPIGTFNSAPTVFKWVSL